MSWRHDAGNDVKMMGRDGSRWVDNLEQADVVRFCPNLQLQATDNKPLVLCIGNHVPFRAP
jgi:hypothetical protein